MQCGFVHKLRNSPCQSRCTRTPFLLAMRGTCGCPHNTAHWSSGGCAIWGKPQMAQIREASASISPGKLFIFFLQSGLAFQSSKEGSCPTHMQCRNGLAQHSLKQIPWTVQSWCWRGCARCLDVLKVVQAQFGVKFANELPTFTC